LAWSPFTAAEFGVARFVRSAAVAGAAVVLAIISGCGPGGLDEVKSAGELRHIIAAASQPVMVEFSKQTCDHCGGLEITLKHLADEYAGQVRSVKFVLLRADGSCIDQQLADEHSILVYPTVLFFVNGRKAARFEQHYTYSDYEEAIKACMQTTQPDSPGP
jgi:thioredoxin 1